MIRSFGRCWVPKQMEFGVNHLLQGQETSSSPYQMHKDVASKKRSHKEVLTALGDRSQKQYSKIWTLNSAERVKYFLTPQLKRGAEWEEQRWTVSERIDTQVSSDKGCWAGVGSWWERGDWVNMHHLRERGQCGVGLWHRQEEALEEKQLPGGTAASVASVDRSTPGKLTEIHAT